MEWKQGEHVCIIGSTGSGKTYLESKLLPLRLYVLVMRTKADDVKFDGFTKIKSIEGIRSSRSRYLLEPKYERARYELHRAFELAWKQGSWCVAVDELFYLCDRLKLDSDAERLLTQGRSLRVSVVCGMQRPSRITRFALSEATHVFCFRLEGRDIKLVEESTTPRMVPAILGLQQYQFAYFNRVTGDVKVGKAQQLGAL